MFQYKILETCVLVKVSWCSTVVPTPQTNHSYYTYRTTLSAQNYEIRQKRDKSRLRITSDYKPHGLYTLPVLPQEASNSRSLRHIVVHFDPINTAKKFQIDITSTRYHSYFAIEHRALLPATTAHCNVDICLLAWRTWRIGFRIRNSAINGSSECGVKSVGENRPHDRVQCQASTNIA